MILWFVILYLLASVGIGLCSETRPFDEGFCRRREDPSVAGGDGDGVRDLVRCRNGAGDPPATFVKDGLQGVVADPFGSSLCLILAGLFFARRLYRLNVLTIGDYYRIRYNRTVEVLCTLCIVASYLGWVSAQIKALGLIFYVVTDGAVMQSVGMVIGAAICPDLYDIRRDVFRRHSRLRANHRDHGRDALYRFRDQRPDRRSRGRIESRSLRRASSPFFPIGRVQRHGFPLSAHG